MRIREITQSDIGKEFDGNLYHVTPADNVQNIESNGIQPVSYWGIGRITNYYIEDVEGSNGEAKVYHVPLSEFDKTLLEPDVNGIEEPLTHTLGVNEEDIWNKWELSDKTWQDSLNLIGSVRYRGVVPPLLLSYITNQLL